MDSTFDLEVLTERQCGCKRYGLLLIRPQVRLPSGKAKRFILPSSFTVDQVKVRGDGQPSAPPSPSLHSESVRSQRSTECGEGLGGEGGGGVPGRREKSFLDKHQLKREERQQCNGDGIYGVIPT